MYRNLSYVLQMILMMLDFYLKYKVREREVEGRKRGKDQNPAIVYEEYLKPIFFREENCWVFKCIATNWTSFYRQVIVEI